MAIFSSNIMPKKHTAVILNAHAKKAKIYTYLIECAC